MIEQSEVKDGVLIMSCLFNVKVDRVFQAWTDPRNMSQWMGPGTVTCESADIDLQIGGKYRLAMRTDDGVMIAFGEYREIEADSKLVFTWQWEGGGYTDSLVTLIFTELQGQTRLQLVHRELPDASVAEHHGQGWAGSLTKLEQFLSG